MPLIFIAIVLGIVEGLTEFIPVSSTGHLILAGHMLGFTGAKASTFDVFIQLGAVLAGAVYYRKRFLSLLVFDMKKFNIFHVGIAMIPAGVVGVLFHKPIKELFSPTVVVISLLLGSVLMLFAEKSSNKKTFAINSLDELTYKHAFSIGVFQCLALIPGFSRSGSTISGGILSGVSYKTSADFTFIVAVPMMFGASIVDLKDIASTLYASDIIAYLIGFLVAFVVALLSIVLFLNLLSKLKLAPFAYYRIIIAILCWILLI